MKIHTDAISIKKPGFSFAPSIHLSEREDGETIRKTQNLMRSTIPAITTNTSGTTATGTNSILLNEVPAQNWKEAIDPEMLRSIDEEIAAEPNYLVRVQILIGKLLAQLIQISEKERTQKEGEKVKFLQANRESGNIGKTMGNRSFYFSFVALGTMACQFLVPESDRQFVKYLSDNGCNNLVNMLNSSDQAKQKVVDGVGALARGEIDAMMSRGSSESSSKQELINLLEKLFESLKRASQAG